MCSSGPEYGGCIKIGCLAEPVEQLVALAEAPSSIGLRVGFVLAGVVYAVLAPLTTRRSTQSAFS